jgi:hypothetical protein
VRDAAIFKGEVRTDVTDTLSTEQATLHNTGEPPNTIESQVPMVHSEADR